MADAEGDGQVPILAGTASRADIKPRVAVRSTEKQHQSKSKQQAKKTSEKGTTGKKLWLLNGRIYNYYKEGAREVQSQADAERIIRGEGEVRNCQSFFMLKWVTEILVFMNFPS